LCIYNVEEIEPCGVDIQRRLIKIHGSFWQIRRSFIFKDTGPWKDGEVLVNIAVRPPVYLLTAPLQLMIYENKQDVPRNSVIDLGAGAWENVRIYKMHKEYHCYSTIFRSEREICTLTMPDGIHATFLIRYKDGDSYSGDLFLSIDDKGGRTCERLLLKGISAPHNWGWFVVDDNGEVAYDRAGNLFTSEPFKTSGDTVVYRFMWQSGKLDPFVELAYGELVR
jgi:hypothetical protein